MSIRIMIADDHEVVRSGLATLFSETEIEIIEQVSNGRDSVRLAVEKEPDVVLLDIRMPGVDGFETLRRFKNVCPRIPVLILSTYDNPTYLARARALGAKGYVSKGAPRQDLLSAVRKVARGEQAWSSQDLRRITGSISASGASEEGAQEQLLTRREGEVLQQLSLGLSNKEIATALHISVETVKEHVHHILDKLGVSGRTQAAVWAVRQEQLQ